MTRGIGDPEHDQEQDQGNVVAYEALSLPQPHLILLARANARDILVDSTRDRISATVERVAGREKERKQGQSRFGGSP